MNSKFDAILQPVITIKRRKQIDDLPNENSMIDDVRFCWQKSDFSMFFVKKKIETKKWKNIPGVKILVENERK